MAVFSGALKTKQQQQQIQIINLTIYATLNGYC